MEKKLSSAYPSATTQNRYVLEILLRGGKFTILDFMYEYNIICITARVSSLRKMGWPVCIIKVAHPNPKFRDQGATLTAWTLDAHFLGWLSRYKRHPFYYPGKEGRSCVSRVKDQNSIIQG